MRPAVSGILSFTAGMLFASFGLCAGGVSLAMFAVIFWVRHEVRTSAAQAEQLIEQSFFADAGDWLLAYSFPIGFLIAAVVSLWLAWESFREATPSRRGSAALHSGQ